MPENAEGPQPGEPVSGQVDQPTSQPNPPVDNDLIQRIGATALKVHGQEESKPREAEESTREQNPNRAAEAAFSSKDMMDKANAYEEKGLTDLAERTRRLATEQEEWAKEQYDKREKLKKEIEPEVDEKMEEVAQFVEFPYPKPLKLATIETQTDDKMFKKAAEKWKVRKTAVVEEVARRLGVEVSDVSGIPFRHPVSQLDPDHRAEIARSFGSSNEEARSLDALDGLTIQEEPTAVENIRLRKIVSNRVGSEGLTTYQVAHVTPDTASKPDPLRF